METYKEEACTIPNDCSDEEFDAKAEITSFSESDADSWKHRVFNTMEEADFFYKEHCRAIGFDARITSSHRCLKSEIMLNTEWTCNHAGFRMSLPPNKRVRKPRKDYRCGCPHIFRVAYDRRNCNYRITKFVTSHNHQMVKPDKSARLNISRGQNVGEKALRGSLKDTRMSIDLCIDVLEEYQELVEGEQSDHGMDASSSGKRKKAGSPGHCDDLDELQVKITEKTMSHRRVLQRKDELDQAFYEETRKLQRIAWDNIERVLSEQETLNIDLGKKKKHLDDWSKQLNRREALIELERKKLNEREALMKQEKQKIEEDRAKGKSRTIMLQMALKEQRKAHENVLLLFEEQKFLSQ